MHNYEMENKGHFLVMRKFVFLCLFSISLLRSFKIASVVKSKKFLLHSISIDEGVLDRAPYDEIIPFLSEHIQLSDQILFLGIHYTLKARIIVS